MSPKDCAYIVERLAIRFMALVTDHERQLTEHRAAFGARTEADAKIIAGLRSEIVAARMAVLERDSLMSERAKLQAMVKEQSDSAKAAGELLGWTANESPIQAVERVVRERDGLLTQVQDMRAEMERLKLACSTYAADWDTAGKACRMRDNEYPLGAVIRLVRDDAERAEVAKRLVAERDALRAEVAALQERLRSSIARGDFAQMEVAALRSQNPKHSVATTNPVKMAVKIGDRVTMSRTPIEDDDYPVKWDSIWGDVGEIGKVVALGSRYGFAIAMIERESSNAIEWPLSCVEIVTEATHDTDAGKAAAESAVRTEPVAEEIKVGDVVKVVGASGCLTAQSDIGKIGEVLKIDFGDGTVLLSGGAGWVNRCDVRKVTT